MSDRSAIKRVFGTTLATLVVAMLLLPVAQAEGIPIDVEYTGTGHYVDLPSDPLALPGPNIVSGDSKGSFGAKSTVIVSNFVPILEPAPTPPCKSSDHQFLLIGYANAVVTFSDGSQIFARGEFGDQGWMCIDPSTGEFFGESYGEFIGGKGRFEGASGTYTAPFNGFQLYAPVVGDEPFPFGPELPFIAIEGSIFGTVTFD
ncbi:MAG TPA: hypothetical protein VLA06_01155 [Woeseiaceae bacterium]|nr:hypothetical protein [Woeseiaceae bacterium]